MRLIADTSAIIAAIVTTEPRHEECHQVLAAATQAWITPHVATEVFHLLIAAGHDEAGEVFLTDIADGFFDLVSFRAQDYADARHLINRYRGTVRRRRPKAGSIDLADAMNVVAAARCGTTVIATLDQDYRGIRPLAGAAYFILLPDDTPGHTA
jgi:predicted nucleic acid-binding protein